MALSSPCSPDSLASSPKTKTWPNATGNIDVVGTGGGPSRYIRVADAGDLAVDYGDSVTDIIPALAAGETISVQARRILASGTTATRITVFW